MYLLYHVHITLIIFRRLSGLAEGVSSVIQCAVRQQWSSIAGCSSIGQFEPRYTYSSSGSTNMLFLLIFFYFICCFCCSLLCNACFFILINTYCYICSVFIQDMYINFVHWFLCMHCMLGYSFYKASSIFNSLFKTIISMFC